MTLKERTVAGTFLHKLPAELLDIIATQTDDGGLKSMRATCRELRDGSASEFFRRHTSLKIHLNSSEEFDILCLEVETKTPNVVMAQAMTQSLILPEASNSLDVSPRNGRPLRDHVPKRVARVYTDASGIGDFELRQRTLIEPSQKSGVPNLLLKRIATLAPQTLALRELHLSDLAVDGDHLIDLLDTHQHNLQHVDLRRVVLTNALECMVALGRIEAQNIFLEDIRVRDDSGNLQYLTAQSPALLSLQQHLLQQNPDAICYILEYGEPLVHAFGFRRSGEV